MNLVHWEGQVLLGLAYFQELVALMATPDFTIRSYVRGNLIAKEQFHASADPSFDDIRTTLVWLTQCRRIARRVGANPPLPSVALMNSKFSDGFRFAISVLEDGAHQQSFEGCRTVATVDTPSDHSPFDMLGEVLPRVEVPEPPRKIELFGFPALIGPLLHGMTNARVLNVRNLPHNRTELTFEGSLTAFTGSN
jgi:hypothetical protein